MNWNMPAALDVRARDAVEAKGSEGQSRVNLSVIDTPCLSQTPERLRERLVEYDAVIFADVCKASYLPQRPWGAW